MKNFKLFLESKELEELFQQEVIEGDVTITHRIDNIKTKKINGKLIIKTIDYGDLRDIQVDEISLHHLGITDLINLPQTLKILDCNNNQITNLDNLPQGLKTLDCWGNKITNLYNLPQTLKTLDCSNNQITNLDNLPQTLKILECCYNKITNLDNLPQGLETLYCRGNKITNLDNLPLTLKKIVYKNTPIHNLVKKYDVNANDINLAFLIKSLQLDSNIHTEELIHPILDILKPEDYKQCSNILSDLSINLNTHSTNEIINIISSL